MGKSMYTLGKKLKELREEKGLTQIELAQIFFLDKSTIAKYETDTIEPTFTMIKRFAKFYKVDLNYFDD